MRKRNHAVYVRFSDEEYAELLKKVKQSKQTLQDYIINTALNGKIPSAEEVMEIRIRNELLKDMDKQLRGMGININQMARIANGYGDIPTIKILGQISSDIKKFKSEVNTVWLLTRQSINLPKPMEQ